MPGRISARDEWPPVGDDLPTGHDALTENQRRPVSLPWAPYMPRAIMLTSRPKRAFTCETCSRVFSRRSHLSSHERTHSGNKPFACTICDKKFTQSGSLNRHVRMHAADQSEARLPYPCSVCARRFGTSKGLSAHTRGSHRESNVSPASPICDLDVAPLLQSGSSMHIPSDVDHLLQVPHLETPPPGPRHNADTFRNEVHVKLQPLRRQQPSLQCLLCWQTFAHSDLVSHHMRVAHSGTLPQACPPFPDIDL
ncbi:hypothetical protein PBRA_003829 [Plasmodiophora brassicae]|uniref:C2H2-type domain-containing protein n=1 Tax=Plasmodiophora brassicae TaxID=37360 RepID=A0A0G4IIF5_PLABS|nr:hypothetical protein PBRA_003829 [Plasmodiophora brassicae]